MVNIMRITAIKNIIKRKMLCVLLLSILALIQVCVSYADFPAGLSVSVPYMCPNTSRIKQADERLGAQGWVPEVSVGGQLRC